MGKYIPLDGFTTKLVGKLPAKNRYVPIFDTTRDYLLRQLVDAGDYSYFILKDGNTIEAVKIENYCGRLLMTRGLERTTSVSFRCGTCLEFRVLPIGIMDWVCQNDACSEILEIPV